ncbi:MAG TPA: hypothetical protein VK436_17145 [Methanocella sp.]|nr:hypothetical protein [Methanocella sp.]
MAKSSYPADDSLFRILYLIVVDKSEKWTMAIPNWGVIPGQLTVYYRGRVEAFS